MCFVGSSPTNDSVTLTFEESKGCPILFLRLRHMLSEPQRSSAQCKTRSTNELPMFSVRMRGCARHLGAQLLAWTLSREIVEGPSCFQGGVSHGVHGTDPDASSVSAFCLGANA